MNRQTLLLFGLQRDIYGMPIEGVREVVRAQHMRLLPGAPEFVEGLLSLREHVLVVMDLRKRFGALADDRPVESEVVVCRVGGLVMGLMVDRVLGVEELPAGPPEPTPRLAAHGGSPYVLGLARRGGDVVILLDVDRLLSPEEQHQLTALRT